MKHIKTFALLLALGGVMVSCKDDVKNPGNPIMEVTGDLGNAYFGQTMKFDVKASDSQVPLSTIHAELYFDSELVDEQVVRTKENGATYSVEIDVPYIANIPDGEATLRLYLQNINFTITEQVYSVKVSHADFPYLTFVADNGNEYRMERVSMYNYEVTDRFEAEMPGKIVTPAIDELEEMTFGYEGSEIKLGATGSIPFTNGAAGNYTIAFNTFTMEGSPFTELFINGNLLEANGDGTFQIDINNLAKGSELTLSGFPNFDEWWLNPDYFKANDDGTFSFMAYDGNYRFIANTNLQYIYVVKLSAGAPATLNQDGTGLPWIIGENIGYPKLSNAPGWNPGRGIPMAPQSETVYQVTVVGGQNINVSSINFKFFGQDDWGTELTGTMLTSQSDLIGVGMGDDGHDNGNLYLKDGVELEANVIYVITLDCTNGIDNAILTTTIAGEQQFEAKKVTLNGKEMNTTDNALFSLVIDLQQNDYLTFTGDVDINNLYLDEDYFENEGGTVKFLPVSGYYNVVLNKDQGTLSAIMTDEAGTELNLNEDGTGNLWLMGWGVGSPSLDYQFGWDPGKAYALAQVMPKVYQFTGKAGPETGSAIGDRYRYDYLSFKFFWQNGWGGEFNNSEYVLEMIGQSESFIQNTGNFELAPDVQLQEGDIYRITVDLTNGVSNGTINFEKL